MKSFNFASSSRAVFLTVLAAAALPYALTNGPGMPEYSVFEPVDATDLVHLSSGGFQYNLPVVTVPGPELSYSMSLNYHSGIKPGQEASWVGLGWNLQPGAITRQINKIPDDYRGISVYDYLKSSNIIVGNSVDVNFLGLSLGVSGDSYHGTGGMVGYAMQLTDNVGIGARAGWNGVYSGYGLTMTAGMFSASMSYDDGTVTGGVGLNLQAESEDKTKTTIMELGSVGVSLSTSGIEGGSVGFMGVQQVGAGITSTRTDERKNGAPLGFARINYRKFSSWIEGYNFNDYYGFMYADVDGTDCRANTNDCANHSPSKTNGMNFKIQEFQESVDPYSGLPDQTQARLHVMTQDNYQVNAQGLSGMFKPYRKEDGDFLNVLANTSKFTLDWFDSGRDYLNRTAALETNRNPLYKDNSGKQDLYWRFVGDQSATNLGVIGVSGRDIGEAYAPVSKKIEPFFNTDPISGKQSTLSGFKITKEDGTIYEFKKPVYTLFERTSTVFKNQVLGSDVDFQGAQTRMGKYAYAWLLTAIKAPDYLNLTLDGLVETGKGGWVKFTYENLPIPYNWMAPYVDKTAFPGYLDTRDYAPDGFSQSAQADGISYSTGRSRQEGRKEISYLKTVETATHVAEFQTQDRADGMGAKPAQHMFTRQMSTCSDCFKGPAAVYNYQLIIPNEWSGIRDGDRLMTHYFSMHIRTVFYEMDEGYIWNVGPCDKTGWDASLMLGGKRVIDWGTLCAEVPPSWQYSGYNPYLGYVHDMKFTIMDNPVSLKYLDKIVVRNKTTETAISHVKFNYNYSLSPGTPNSTSAEKGKLTLASVNFGAEENGPELPPYVFGYETPGQAFQSGTTVGYERFQMDRWGYLSPTATDANHPADPTAVKAWNLNKITLPSGGYMQIAYEANRIRYVGNEDYFRSGTDGYSRVYWHQDVQYSASKTIANNPLTGPVPVSIKGLEIEFKDMDDATWKNQQPEIQYMNGSTLTTLTMAKRTDGAQTRLTWIFPSASVVRAQDITRFRLIGARDKKWMRVSLLIPPPSDPTIAGDGVRVQSIASVEPITQKTNRLLYSYFDGVAEALPNSSSDFNDSRIPSGQGLELFQGTGTEVMYSKVRVEPEGAFGYTDYSFYTPKEFNIWVAGGSKIGADAGGKDLYQVVVNDYSSMWGQLIKKQDFSETNAVTPVREIGHKWIFPAGSVNNLENLQDGFPKVNGKSDLYDFKGLNVDAAGAHFGFGMQQTVSSGRYFYKGCFVSSGCESTPPVATTQVVQRFFMPHLFESYSIYDGVKTTTQNYNFDLLTGRPLNSRVENTAPAGGKEWHITSKVPAYSKYPKMLEANMLTQEAVATKYFYPSGTTPPTYTDASGAVLPISGDAASKAVSGSATRWRGYDQLGIISNESSPLPERYFIWRKAEELSWRDRKATGAANAYSLPNDFCTGAPNGLGADFTCSEGPISDWITNGLVRRYASNGVEQEFLLPSQKSISRLTGRLGKVQAFVANAQYKGLFYESFEHSLEWIPKLTEEYSVERTDGRESKTGLRSVVVTNEGASSSNKLCFVVGDLPYGRPITASVWFFDNTPSSSASPTLPGMSFTTPGGCDASLYPSNLATGSKRWVRFEVGLDNSNCPDVSRSNAKLCIYGGTRAVGANVLYDELRIAPSDAIMTTFTYGLNGLMNSSADENETVTRYEYSRFGDLTGIRNDDGILVSDRAKKNGAR